MGTRLRVTALKVRDHPDAVVRGLPIAEVVILARTDNLMREKEASYASNSPEMILSTISA